MTNAIQCLGEELERCRSDCWGGEQLSEGRRKLIHVGPQGESRIFTAGVMSEGECAAGHDVALERWLHEVSERAHAQ